MSDETSKRNHGKASKLWEQWGKPKTVHIRFTEDWNHPKYSFKAGQIVEWSGTQSALYVACGRATKVDAPKKEKVKVDDGGPPVEVKFLDSLATQTEKYSVGMSYFISERRAKKYIERGLCVPVKAEPQRQTVGPAEKRGKSRA